MTGLNDKKGKCMTNIEASRLEDFKKILTYHIVAKIRYLFKDNFKLYYEAPVLWAKWKNKKVQYDKKIYKLVVMFNHTSLSAHQVQSIFGKDESGKWISYGSILSNDSSIKTFRHGTICMSGRRFHMKTRYQLPFSVIEDIFKDPSLVKKVCDAGSDYYTPRQRRLIFTQINNTKNGYHYKTKQEIYDEMTDDQLVDGLFEDTTIDWSK